MNLKQLLEAADYRVAGGDQYLWHCYGEHAHFMDISDIDGEIVAHIVYDTHTQEIYECTVTYKSEEHVLCYRWTASAELARKRQDEARDRGIDDTIAWDDVKYADLETEEDLLEKLAAIVDHEEFDRRIQVPLDLDKEELFALFKMAHERDMTFNDFIADLLLGYISKNSAS